MPIAVIIGSLLRNHLSQKRVHLGKQLECQLANEYNLKSKSSIKEIVFRMVFYIRNDYRCNNLKHIACVLRNNRFQKKVYIGQNLQCPLANEDDL